MENKGPFLPTEAEFTAPTEEHVESTDNKEKKKKKNKFQVLLDKLLPKKTETEDDKESADDVEGGFIERFRGKLNSFFGVEKDELPEAESGYEPEEFRLPRPILAPIGLQADFEPPTTGAATQTEVSDDEPSDVTPAVETSTVTEANLPEATDTVRVEQVEQIDSATTTNHHSGERPTDEVSVVDWRAVAEPVATELPPDVYNDEMLDVGHEVSEAPVQKEKETVIEKSGGSGAALLGFVAAETLSRSRDKKLKKEGEKLRQRVDKLEATQQNESLEVRAANARNSNQIEELRQRRTEVPISPPKVEINHAPPKAENAYIQAEKRPEQQKANDIRSVIPNPGRRNDREVNSRRSPEVSPDTTQVIQEQIKQAAEKDAALEGYYERRAEIKDDPTVVSSRTGQNLAGSMTSTHNHPSQLQDGANQSSVASPYQQSRSSAPSIYKDAAKQGVTVGVAIIVGLIIIVLLWNLL